MYHGILTGIGRGFRRSKNKITTEEDLRYDVRRKSRLPSAIKMTVSSGHSHSVSGTPGHFYVYSGNETFRWAVSGNPKTASHIIRISDYLISIHILSPEYKTQNNIAAMLPF
ncbi:hypothetical protein DXD79_01470 [Hungatella hathewayi]|uniref:Uncharacterized protein n=1 Tax=Hungatella hathewayi TaxID=154046 RepID=A0A374PDH9_9FIRM|nr:hypothetical protein DXD79_01470 [Hungatella hathewayi]RGK99967.1 hypothetical protein DXC88_02540 [Hungatella hathewayi]